MKSSLRVTASLATLLTAIILLTFAGAEVATAIPVVPPIALAPQLTVTVSHPLISPTSGQEYTVRAHYVNGTALSGRITLTSDRHDGSPAWVLFSTTSLSGFTGGGVVHPIAASIGDVTLTAVFVPSDAGALGATSSASFQVRFADATPSVAVGPLVAGIPVKVTTTITVPNAEAGHPIDGRVSLRTDALGEQAFCLPTAVTSTTAACSTTLPALPAGVHSLWVTWSDSPSFQTASTSTPMSVAPAAKSGAPAPLPASNASASSASPTPTPSPPGATAVAPPVTADPTSLAQGAPNPPSNAGALPPWVVIALVILLIAVLGVAALVVVGVVGSRRSRATA